MNFDRLTAFLDAIPTYGAPGIDCIVQQNYKTIYRHTAGTADLEKTVPMTGKEQFYLFSCTKPITMAAIMQLWEKGLFSLDDPLAKYIPEYENMRVRIHEEGKPIIWNPDEGETEPAEPILIRHLLTMSAGFCYKRNTVPIKRLFAQTNGAMPTLQVVRTYAQSPLLYQPGSHWHYSMAHDIVGGLIEVLSGKKLGEYMQKAVFSPLGMTHTRFAHPALDGTKLMPQYWFDAKTASLREVGTENEYILGSEYESGGAGLVSTVEDYILFASMMANGGVGENGRRILKAETIDLMRTPQLSFAQEKDFCWSAMDGYSYGLGFRTLAKTDFTVTAAPKGEFGWGGAAGCYTSFSPETGIAVFYAQHMRKSMEPYIHPQIRNFVYGGLNL